MNFSATGRGLGAAMLVLALGGCGSDDPAGPGGGGGGGGGGGTTPVATTAVSVRDNQFDPAAILVSPGATVTFTWVNTGQPHNVTWVSGGLTNSQTVTSGSHQNTMPTTLGELVYYCTIHGTASSGMRGTVRVQ